MILREITTEPNMIFDRDWVLNNWRMSIGLTHKPKIYQNTALRGGPRWRFSKEILSFCS